MARRQHSLEDWFAMVIRYALVIFVIAALGSTGCKKEFDPVESFKAHVQRFRVALESKLPDTCTFKWDDDDINIEKSDSITKPWYGEGVQVEIEHDSLRKKTGKAWTENQEKQILAGKVPTKTVVQKNRTKGVKASGVHPVKTKIVKESGSIYLGWFYSKNDNRWHLSKAENYASWWFDPVNKKQYNLAGIVVVVDEEMQ